MLVDNSCVLDNKDQLQNAKILVEDTVFNCKFNNLDLTTDDVEKLASEIATLNNFNITERVLSLYDYMANSYRTIIKDIDNHFGNFKGLIDSTQFEDFAKDKEYKDSELSLCKEILSCRNSKGLINNHLREVTEAYLGSNSSVNINGQNYTYSTAYVQEFFERNNIRKVIFGLSDNEIFEVANKDWCEKKINESAMKSQNEKLFAPIIEIIESEYFQDKNVLTDLAVAPENAMKYIIDKCPEIDREYMRTCAGYEGYTLREHTENTLRFLQENFGGQLPDKLKGLLNLILIIHDLGKPEAYLRGYQKGSFKEYLAYVVRAKKVFATLGIDYIFAEHIINFYFNTQPFTTYYYVFENEGSLQSLNGECRKFASAIGVDSNYYLLLSTMARILQTCDSGAYTTYCKTRRNDVYCKVGNYLFTSNFAKNKFGYRFKEDAVDNFLDDFSAIEKTLF